MSRKSLRGEPSCGGVGANLVEPAGGFRLGAGVVDRIAALEADHDSLKRTAARLARTVVVLERRLSRLE